MFYFTIIEGNSKYQRLFSFSSANNKCQNLLKFAATEKLMVQKVLSVNQIKNVNNIQDVYVVWDTGRCTHVPYIAYKCVKNSPKSSCFIVRGQKPDPKKNIYFNVQECRKACQSKESYTASPRLTGTSPGASPGTSPGASPGTSPGASPGASSGASPGTSPHSVIPPVTPHSTPEPVYPPYSSYAPYTHPEKKKLVKSLYM